MGTFLAWFLAAGLQTARDVRVYHRPPVPVEYLKSGALFGTLSVIGQASAETNRAMGVLAWGVLIALTLQAFSSSGGTAGLLGKAPPGPAPGTAPGGAGGRGGTSPPPVPHRSPSGPQATGSPPNWIA